MKRVEIVILTGFIFAIILSNLLTFVDKYDKLKDSVIRIHILANSNSSEDQDLKYKIKDDIYKAVSDLLKDVKNKSEAKRVICDNLDYITKISNDKIKEKGLKYTAAATLEKSYFPTRSYDGFTFPAGSYDALKIFIGEGAGQNWWCVAFPPMCSPLSSSEDFLDVLGEDQVKMINEPCEYKLAILELILNFGQKLKSRD